MPHLFHFITSILIAAISLLWLPEWGLIPLPVALLIATGALMTVFIAHRFNFLRLKFWAIQLLVMILACGYFHSEALTLLNQANQLAKFPHNQQLTLEIIALQQQQHYQTLIAQTRFCKNCPEQRLFVNWQAPSQPQIGEIWFTDVKLRPIAARLNFGGFDRQQWFLANRITAVAQVKKAQKLTEKISIRQQQLIQVKQATEGLSQQGLLMALAFGERAWLPADIWKIYQQTNTAHLIAISGLHIGLAMAFGFYLLRVFQWCLPQRLIGIYLPFIGGVILAAAYAYLAGFAIPTQRALLALLLILLGRAIRHHYSSLQWFFLVVAGLCLWDPLMVLSASFWLSVTAVFSLLIWYRYIPTNILQWYGKPFIGWRSVVWGLFHLQLGLLLLFTPLQLYFFHGIAASGFLANLVAVPLYSFILVPLVLFALMFNGVWQSWLGANWVAEKITEILTYLDGYWVNVSVTHALLWIPCLALLFIALVYFLYPQEQARKSEIKAQQAKRLRLNPKRKLPLIWRRQLYLSVFILCVVANAFYLWQPNKNHWRLVMLDVGQGLALAIIKDDHAVLFDTGASWENGSMAEIEILPYLRSQGIEIENIILSHDDNDHSGGINFLFSAFPQAKLISSSRKQYTNVAPYQREFCHQGIAWQWRGLSFQALWPPQLVTRAANHDSCVVLVTDGKYRLLLTGDADLAAEVQFAKNLEAIDVLQVGHHGSKTATSELLLKQTQPQIALISAGRFNPWGFPHPSVVTRLQQSSTTIFNSGTNGAVTLIFSPQGIAMQQARDPWSPWFAAPIGL